MNTQLCVLGAGPGGYAAAFLAADLGLQVTLVDFESRLGGVCLLRGCIPSKALLHVAKAKAEAKQLAEWGVAFADPTIDLAAMRARKEKVIATLTGGLKQLAAKRNVDGRSRPGGLRGFAHAEARFGRWHAVGRRSNRVRELHRRHGLEPDANPCVRFADAPRDGFHRGVGIARRARVAAGRRRRLHWARDGHRLCRPRKQSVGRRNDRRTAARRRPRPGQTASEAAPGHFRGDLSQRQGCFVGRSARFDRGRPSRGTCRRRCGNSAACCLCVGRRPNTAGLGLEKIGVQLDPRGFISVDRQRRTGNPRILAIGDAAGEPMLAHKAAHEGKTAVEVILGKSVAFEPKAIPAVVFTDPEIAWAGLTETEAKRQGRTVEVAQFPWMASGRAQAIGRTEGLTKWIVDPQTKLVVGCGIVGYGAGDLISEAVLAIEMGCLGPRRGRNDPSASDAQRDARRRRRSPSRLGHRHLPAAARDKTTHRRRLGRRRGDGEAPLCVLCVLRGESCSLPRQPAYMRAGCPGAPARTRFCTSVSSTPKVASCRWIVKLKACSMRFAV